MDPQVKFARRTDGVGIAYCALGKGQPFIYPAPWVTDVRYFLEDPNARRFWENIARHFTVLYYDKHGCGLSDRERTDFTLESDVADLEAVIEHVGPQKCILFGSSCGGVTSLAYTARHPEKVSHLILYGSFANGANLAKDDVKSAFVSLVRSVWGVGSKVLADLFVPDASPEDVQRFSSFQRRSCEAETAAKLLELAYKLDVTDLLPEIALPTLVLHREGDKLFPLHLTRELAANIPGAVFKILKGNVHIPWLGESSDVVSEISEFLGKEVSDTSDKADIEAAAMAEVPVAESEVFEQATIVFSDIVSSTDIVTQLGDVAARALFLKHDKLVRDRLRRHRGKEFQNLGDGFMLSFESASAAIRCASEIQKEVSESIPSIKIRMGINTGEVVIREGEQPFGQAVVVASRIASSAQGGEILVSEVTRQMAAGSVFAFIGRGEARLKGFEEVIKMHEVS
jgi:class 3 adenylate cyclase/fermentation-respiration switch protein FrsA (DUF1100 family)